MTPGPDGMVTAAVINRQAGLGVYQRYPRAALPHHITWRQLGTGTYVVAMEPSTNRDAGGWTPGRGASCSTWPPMRSAATRSRSARSRVLKT